MSSKQFLPNYPELLTVANAEYSVLLLELWSWWLKSDNFADAQSPFSRTGTLLKANLVTKENGVFAGGEELVYVIKHFFDQLSLDLFFDDGDIFKPGDVLLQIVGNAHQLLFLERTLINFLARMSGIATKVSSLKAGLKYVDIAATRKTLWGILDKKAVTIGGGLTHRLSFNQALMIKDNDWNWFTKVLTEKNESKLDLLAGYSFLEVEVEDDVQLDSFLAFADSFLKRKNAKGLLPLGVLLDNLEPEKLKPMIKKIPPALFVEASGGINERNLTSYDLPDLDFVSMGSLTKSVASLDFSLAVLN